MIWLLLNVPLMVLFFALCAGVPMWLVLKHPDTGPTPAQAPAVTRLPMRRHEDDDHRRAA
jgi:hypothetical protein